MLFCFFFYVFFFFQAEDGIRDLVRSRGLGDVYKRQLWYGAGSVAQQAQLLSLKSADTASPVLVMRPGRRAPALFCLHTIGGLSLIHI